MMKRLAILAALALTACGATLPRPEPRVEIQTVYVPKPVSCVDKAFANLGEVPDTDVALKAAPGLDQFTQLLLAGRGIREAWIASARAQIDICRRAGDQ